jgi:hypothetical protein
VAHSTEAVSLAGFLPLGAQEAVVAVCYNNNAVATAVVAASLISLFLKRKTKILILKQLRTLIWMLLVSVLIAMENTWILLGLEVPTVMKVLTPVCYYLPCLTLAP